MEVFATIAATWPPAEIRRAGPWTLRRGEGGGGRVSAATLDGPLGDPAEAEAAMRLMDQRPLFMVRPGEQALDAALAARGYMVQTPTALFAADAAALGGPGPDWSTIRCDAALARMVEIWTECGVGPGRRAVMDRARPPKVWLLARDGDRPAGCAFIGAGGSGAMIHALAIRPASRRRGLGGRVVRAAARWAAAQGASRLTLAVDRANAPAMALYEALGMAEIGGYHYRVAPGPDTPGH